MLLQASVGGYRVLVRCEEVGATSSDSQLLLASQLLPQPRLLSGLSSLGQSELAVGLTIHVT